MASGHMNRVKRPDTWLHRLQNAKKALANPEPSTHDPLRKWSTLGVSAINLRFSSVPPLDA
jgi:hypothetical protein